MRKKNYLEVLTEIRHAAIGRAIAGGKIPQHVLVACSNVTILRRLGVDYIVWAESEGKDCTAEWLLVAEYCYRNIENTMVLFS